MKSHFIHQEFTYDGSQLKSLFAYLREGVQGDSVVSWMGPCSIPSEHMVDGEDLLAGATIAGDKMLHFIIEKFTTSLFAAVCLQRLFAAICLDLLQAKLSDAQAKFLVRRGDDLYFGDGKLSISIATLSPVSALIHFAINCTNDGTPVKTACLKDLGFDGHDFAQIAMRKLTEEVASIEEATVKVRWVK